MEKSEWPFHASRVAPVTIASFVYCQNQGKYQNRYNYNGKRYIQMMVWLVVFQLPSTSRSFRDSTPIYCPLWRTWSSVLTPSPPGIEPRAVAWQSITQPLCHASYSYIQMKHICIDIRRNVSVSKNKSNVMFYCVHVCVYNSLLGLAWCGLSVLWCVCV